MIGRAVFYLNRVKGDVFETARACAALCREEGIVPMILARDREEWTRRFAGEAAPADVPTPEGADAVFVFGGDGTMLRALDEFSRLGLPMLGINLGRVGFLQEVQTDGMREAVARLARGDWRVSRRMMLSYEAHSGGAVYAGEATNEVSVSRGLSQRMIAMDVLCDGELVEHTIADGVLIASPTGSTAYSLAAGGPIISPDVECLLVTPVCPHKLDSRPVVLSDRRELTLLLNMKEPREGIQLSADGAHVCELHRGDRVIVRRSPTDARMIRLAEEGNLYSLLRSKLSQVNL